MATIQTILSAHEPFHSLSLSWFLMKSFWHFRLVFRFSSCPSSGVLVLCWAFYSYHCWALSVTGASLNSAVVVLSSCSCRLASFWAFSWCQTAETLASWWGTLIWMTTWWRPMGNYPTHLEPPTTKTPWKTTAGLMCFIVVWVFLDQWRPLKMTLTIPTRQSLFLKTYQHQQHVGVRPCIPSVSYSPCWGWFCWTSVATRVSPRAVRTCWTSRFPRTITGVWAPSQCWQVRQISIVGFISGHDLQSDCNAMRILWWLPGKCNFSTIPQIPTCAASGRFVLSKTLLFFLKNNYTVQLENAQLYQLWGLRKLFLGQNYIWTIPNDRREITVNIFDAACMSHT